MKKSAKKFKKVVYMKPNGKLVHEIIAIDEKELDLVVVGRFFINEAGAVVG